MTNETKTWGMNDNIVKDPEPIIPFVHQKGGYGDYIAAVFAARTDDNEAAAHLYNNVLSHDASYKKLRSIAFYHSVLAGDTMAVSLAKLQHDDAVANLVLANHAISQGDYKTAINYFKQPSSDTLSRLTYPLLQAWCLYGDGQKQQAIALLEQNSLHNPLGALYLFHEGLMYYLDNNYQKAGVIFSKSDQLLMGTDLFLTQAYGHWLYVNHRGGKAEAMVDNLINTLPFLGIAKQDIVDNLKNFPIQNTQQAIAHVYLAMASLIQQDLSSQDMDNDAQEDVSYKVSLHTEQIFLRLALQLDPDASSARMMLSNIFAQEKLYHAAKNILLPIPEVNPLKAVMQLRVARLNAVLHNTDAAEKQLKELLVHYDHAPDIWQALGDLYMDQKKYHEAILAYTNELKYTNTVRVEDWPIFFARAMAYEKVGLWPKAEADLRKALTMVPNEPMLLNYLGYSLVLRKQNLPEAQKILQKAVDIEPNEGAIRDSLGWAMLMNGQLPQAIEQLEQASEVIPTDPELNYHLGVAYWKGGRHQEAINQWNVALMCSPTADEEKLIHQALENAQKGLDPI